jgi:hypothetical protein
MTWLWWRSRSRIAVATTGSADTTPHSSSSTISSFGLLSSPRGALGARVGEAGHQRPHYRELHRIAGEDGFAPERNGEMGLADAGRAQEQHVLAVGNPAAGGEVADVLRIDRGLRLEIEAGQVARPGKWASLAHVTPASPRPAQCLSSLIALKELRVQVCGRCF